ncbi:hypothetical protein LTR10_023845 [Elasticomyces elasticus]|uniref:SnoaL-like domain-containing protein n=1 Tax=Exophiala sideris TaxID=1016849 RepID=A0ABR0JK82_9EURO|nr:hypothetical protein LTR10_023845 [Elasticomyces elasticus]KAK5035475.1 hypothetical protein LTS07_002913 [Exophiala sideris]KAK5066400.1 hypothetical protein LTR69_002919 [Exophiala sideris]KAK5187077.1 hypothetical protein LTR44_001084 [Eurotiomycetes sp. CCFEE 6388]
MSSKEDIYKTVQPPIETRPPNARRNNADGPLDSIDTDALERFKIREICEGWPTYRDAAEWENYRSMFHDDAYIATSWSQGPVDNFIESSKKAFAAQKEGMFYILHRVTGQTVDLQGDRAVSKMKVTITCRANIDGKEMDNEADCRFFFLLEKRNGRWGVVFYTLLFDKDKMVEVNPSNGGFEIPEHEVAEYPAGYKYLCWCEAKVGKPPKMDLNAHGPERDILYAKCKDWLEGREVRPNLTGHDIIEY